MHNFLNNLLDLVHFGNLDGGLDNFLHDVFSGDDLVDDRVDRDDFLDNEGDFLGVFLDENFELGNFDNLSVDDYIVDDLLDLVNHRVLDFYFNDLFDHLWDLDNILF